MTPVVSLRRVAVIIPIFTMVSLASPTVVSPAASVPNGSPGEISLSPIEEGDDPGNGSMTRSTKITIPVVLVLSITLIVALYCFRHWSAVARCVSRKGSTRPPRYVHRLSHDLVLRPTTSGHSSTTPMVQKSYIVPPPPLLHQAAERVSAPFASALGGAKTPKPDDGWRSS